MRRPELNGIGAAADCLSRAAAELYSSARAGSECAAVTDMGFPYGEIISVQIDSPGQFRLQSEHCREDGAAVPGY